MTFQGLFRNFLKYFNGIDISTTLVLPILEVLPVIFTFTLAFYITLHFYFNIKANLFCYHLDHLFNVDIKVPTFLNNYHYILLNYALALLHQDIFALYTCVMFISLMWSVKGAYFSNITCLFPPSTSLAIASAPALVIVLIPLANMYAPF